MKFQALQPARTRTMLRWLRARPDEFGIGRLFDRVPDGVVVADVDTGLIVLWNPAAAAMFGYAAGEVVGRRIEMLMPTRFRDRHAAGMQHYQATGHGNFIDHGRPMTLPALTKAGTEFWIELTLSPIAHEANGRHYVLAIIRDITDRVRAEEAARRAAEQLEERVKERTAAQETAMRELEAFSYSVSHDLRAPLRAIDGFSQIVIEDYGPGLPAEAQRYLQLIRTASQQMAQLIDDLLRLSRVSRADLCKTPVDMSALVREKLAELQRLSPREGLTIEVSDGCTAYGDAQLLPLLVGNLLENAWKFTRKTPKPSIAFGCEQHGGETIYHVRDNGVGFDMAYVDKLFKPFSRLHKTEDFDGTGIGLATVQRVVSRHGGRAWAEGSPDGGATFYFSLPSAPVKAPRRAR